ncbi:MAG: hypothetical protein JSV04_03465, partial [Candidatus Heimdallarchaeota archaeon]
LKKPFSFLVTLFQKMTKEKDLLIHSECNQEGIHDDKRLTTHNLTHRRDEEFVKDEFLLY